MRIRDRPLKVRHRATDTCSVIDALPAHRTARRTNRRSPRRLAPLVVLVALLAYALVVFSLVTGSSTAKAAAVGDTSIMDPWTLPSMPPKCAEAAVTAGDVGNCVITDWGDPGSKGWGTPPFPYATVGAELSPGWTWLGWSYNKSAALADWEAGLESNTERIGTLKAGSIRAPKPALVLFEGFLAEIQAAGFKVTDGIAYNFRCTSNTRKDCAGLTARSLSNHSWGLAVDINVSRNPEISYVPDTASGSTTACATPMKTDIPRWVVQTAEKWGLLWGGYGWNGGCASPQSVRSSILRDPMHFEFRGTFDQALAVAAFNGVIVERFCSDVVVVENSTTRTERRCTWKDKPQADWRIPVSTGASAGATAALVNITLTGADASGYVTAESCSTPVEGLRSWSNGNVVPGQTVANLAVVPLDAQGRFCLYQSSAMHVVVDVQGWFAPSAVAGAAGSLFSPLSPTRVVDTRGSGTKPSSLARFTVPVGHAPAGAVAALANLTVTNTDSAGYLTADSCTSLVDGEQQRSNVNFAAADTVANLAVVPMANSSFCTLTNVGAHQVIDVQGIFAPAPVGQWGYAPVAPSRLLDTRQCPNGTCPGPNKAGKVVRIQAPAGASAVLVNLTLTGAATGGYATAAACSKLVSGPQAQSNANVAKGGTAANLAVVPVDADGSFCVYTSSTTHVIVDLQGTFSPAADLRFTSSSPTRRLDTRR